MNPTVIVTGASNGIGKAIAKVFASNYFNVVLADVDEENGFLLQDELLSEGRQAQFIRCDVSDPKSIQNLVKETLKRYSTIDVLINNAGISEFIRPDELSVEKWDQILNTNLRASFLLTREVVPHMKKTKKGSVVNIASTRAIMSEKNSEAYAASKGGLQALTHAQAVSHSKENITVNCISPGWIHTGDYNQLRDIDHEQHPSKRVGKPEDVARACLFLTDPENDFINGENLVMDGGMTRKMIYEH
ncbi:SDR family NAD(P)-dependent oxidoreductase [Rhodohalobacter halophilus]|uniref:SDR family NAD(P)-dependent oxidoreductase n=1 Tax=Rhodohalobacter halophilus TaxID=1812810 RepID=UPI00083FC121|nr:SDR family oxidoreductase [Rhodohalobacter halophilus]